MKQNIDRYIGLKRSKAMRCGVIGQGINKFPFPYKEGNIKFRKYKKILKSKVRGLMLSGVRIFSGCVSKYSDLDFLDAVFELQKENRNIFSEAIIPRGNQIVEKDNAFFKKTQP